MKMGTSEEDDAIETLAHLSLDPSSKSHAPMPGSASGPNGNGVGALDINKGSGAETGGITDSSKRGVGSYNGNGISLVVDVRANDGGKVSGGAVKDYSKISYGKLLEMFDSSVLPSQFVGEKGDMIDDGKETAEEVGEDGGEDNVEHDIGEEDDDYDDIDQEHGYSVGDFVWGKIRSHPWWPGQIYDPANASEHAAKHKGKGRFLVAYFGDNSFSWSSPSHLKGFVENFDELSKQSTSKSFINAVEDAVDQFGSLLELEMTCPCVPEGIGITRPETTNAGIKAEVLLPEGSIHKLSKSCHKPAELLANVRGIAEGLTVDSLLELRVLKSWLSAFYHARRGYSLPVYCKPQLIEGLEDKSKNEVVGATDRSVSGEVPIAGAPEEDWLSFPVGPRASQANQSMILGDKLCHRRKQKSVAELMKEDINAEPEFKKQKVMKKRTNSSPKSGNEKGKGNHEAEIQDGGVFNTSLLGKKSGENKTEKSEPSRKPRRNKETADGHVGVGGESPLSRELNGSNDHRVEYDKREVEEQAEGKSASRERKKSRYLSPPYTSPKLSPKNSSLKGNLEIESQTVVQIAHVGERMTMAADKLIGSSPTLRCSADVFEKELPKEISTGHKKSRNLSTETAKQGKKLVCDLMKINAASNEVLLGVQSAAINPLSWWDKKSLDMVAGFISIYRNSIYMNGSYYKTYHRHQSGSKRKFSISEYETEGEDLEQTVHQLTKLRSKQTRKKQAKPHVPNVEQAGKDEKVNGRAAEGNDKLRIALTIFFPSGVSIPSKEYLVRKFNEFGAVNQMETSVMYHSYCARIVFVNSSDTERVFNLVAKSNPFGDANVDYQLSYYSATLEDQNASTPSKTLKIPASQKSNDESSQLQVIKQKLKKMQSMLKDCDDGVSHDMKCNLEEEAKDLLEKVITMASS